MNLFDQKQNALGKNKTTKKKIEVNLRKGRYLKAETPIDREIELAKIENEVELERIRLESKKIDLLAKCVDASFDAEQMMIMGSVMDQTTRSITVSQFQPSLAIRASSESASTRRRQSTRVDHYYQKSPMKIVEGIFLRELVQF